jgi:hypothetical protein
VGIPAPVERKPAERKAFSSDDFQRGQEFETVNKARLNELSGQKAISSDMYFGREERQVSQEVNADYIKEEAAKYAHKAAEKAGELKNKAMGLINQLSQRFS